MMNMTTEIVTDVGKALERTHIAYTDKRPGVIVINGVAHTTEHASKLCKVLLFLINHAEEGVAYELRDQKEVQP